MLADRREFLRVVGRTRESSGKLAEPSGIPADRREISRAVGDSGESSGIPASRRESPRAVGKPRETSGILADRRESFPARREFLQKPAPTLLRSWRVLPAPRRSPRRGGLLQAGLPGALPPAQEASPAAGRRRSEGRREPLS